MTSQTTPQISDNTVRSRPRFGGGLPTRLAVGVAVAAMTLALLAGRSEAGMNMHNGLKVNNGMKVHNGLKVNNGLKVHNGLKVNNGLKVHNGLGMHNGMKVHNGLGIHNGLKVNNGLGMHNGMKVHNGLGMHNGMKVHNGMTPARIWLENGIDPRAPLSAATTRAVD